MFTLLFLPGLPGWLGNDSKGEEEGVRPCLDKQEATGRLLKVYVGASKSHKKHEMERCRGLGYVSPWVHNSQIVLG